MRIHGSAKSPDHWGRTFRACPAIILDGQWMRNVMMADDVEGLVQVVVVRKDGKPVIDASGKFVRHKVLRGKVQIIGAKHTDAVN